MKADSVKARQIEAAARAMWARDWIIATDLEQERIWPQEPASVKESYRDLARRALHAAAVVRERSKAAS